ncbi:MAG TPA: hypothetical protein VFG20_09950 [Planctomycetaceae bacterium]|nr:hypothetical protein [Planctomycetaceae bacterium]
MTRYLASLLVGGTLTIACQFVAADEDPFGPPPPLPPETARVVSPPVTPPAEVVPPKPRPATVPPAPTAAQKRVHERAAEAAQQRKARIQQRRHASPIYPPGYFVGSGPLAHPAVFAKDPGIAIAFRPITLSGLDPLPTPRPSRVSSSRKPPRAPVPVEDRPKPEKPVGE